MGPSETPAASTFLIGFVAAEGDGETFGVDDEIVDVERDKSGATKGTLPAEKEQRPIARAVEHRRQRGERAAQLGGREAARPRGASRSWRRGARR